MTTVPATPTMTPYELREAVRSRLAGHSVRLREGFGGPDGAPMVEVRFRVSATQEMYMRALEEFLLSSDRSLYVAEGAGRVSGVRIFERTERSQDAAKRSIRRAQEAAGDNWPEGWPRLS